MSNKDITPSDGAKYEDEIIDEIINPIKKLGDNIDDVLGADVEEDED